MITEEHNLAFEKSLFTLMVKHPFYGLFLSEIGKFLTEEKELVPTAAISKIKGSLNLDLLFNVEFLMSLEKDERLTVLAHEAQHVILDHLFVDVEIMGTDMPSKTEDEMCNIAMDMYINQNLIGEGFKKLNSMCLPSTFPHLNLEEKKDTRYYYEKLKEAYLRFSNKGSSGDELFDKFCESCKNEDKFSGSFKPGESGGEVTPDLLSNLHNTWVEVKEQLTVAEQKELRDNVTNILKNIAEDESVKLPGSLSNRIKDRISKNITFKPPVIDWKRQARLFTSSVISDNRRRSKIRPNFRFPDAPGVKRECIPFLIYAIDSSGSMSDFQLNEIFNEIYHAYKKGIKIRVIIWDTEIISDYIYKGKKQWKRESSGGTIVDPVIRLANEEKNCDGIIIFTDGYISISEKLKIPGLWVINGGTSDYILKIQPKSKIIFM